MPSQVDNTSQYFARTMRNSDLDLVVQNEAAVNTHPWNKRIFIDCLRSGYQCWVLANKQSIVAHGVMSVAIGECHLLTLCVQPDHQRRGLARKLFTLILDRAVKQGAQECFLEVRKSNNPGIELYRSMGFVQVGERKNYYPTGDDREDALIMSRSLPIP
jgi:ribosomal-protein-alanine N-acetyltransferase